MTYSSNQVHAGWWVMCDLCYPSYNTAFHVAAAIGFGERPYLLDKRQSGAAEQLSLESCPRFENYTLSLALFMSAIKKVITSMFELLPSSSIIRSWIVAPEASTCCKDTEKNSNGTTMPSPSGSSGRSPSRAASAQRRAILRSKK